MCFTISFCLFSVTSITNPQDNLSLTVHVPCLPLYDLCDALYSTFIDLYVYYLLQGLRLLMKIKSKVFYSVTHVVFFNDTHLFVIYDICFINIYVIDSACLFWIIIVILFIMFLILFYKDPFPV